MSNESDLKAEILAVMEKIELNYMIVYVWLTNVTAVGISGELRVIVQQTGTAPPQEIIIQISPLYPVLYIIICNGCIYRNITLIMNYYYMFSK